MEQLPKKEFETSQNPGNDYIKKKSKLSKIGIIILLINIIPIVLILIQSDFFTGKALKIIAQIIIATFCVYITWILIRKIYKSQLSKLIKIILLVDLLPLAIILTISFTLDPLNGYKYIAQIIVFGFIFYIIGRIIYKIFKWILS